MTKTALITGASSGIGMATAITLAAKGYKLIICGRRMNRLQSLKDKIDNKVQIYMLTFDVRSKSEVIKAIDSLPNEWKQIDLLVNNAGNAHGLAPIHEGSSDDWDQMMDGNVKGLLYVTQAILPFMKEKKNGHIINISSIAGKETYANGTAYCASKAGVEAISKGLRLELAEFGIKVTNIAPGAVNTEFSSVRFKGDTAKAHKVYEGFEPLIAEDIANLITYCAEQPEHVQIADVTIFPKAQSSATNIYRGG